MKKILSLLLGLSILASSTAVFANDDKGLEKALGNVKTITGISTDQYDAFNYSMYEENGKKVWDFSWDCDDGSAYARYREDGALLSFDKYKYYDPNNWSEMPKSEAREIAESFLKRIGDKYYKSLILNNETKNGKTVDFNYSEAVNGIKIVGRNVNVTVDCLDKEVTAFNREVPTDKTFQQAEKYLTKEEAIEKFKENNKMKLIYIAEYNYHTEQNEVRSAYVLENREDVGINAITGEKCEYTWYEPVTVTNDEAKEMAMGEAEEAYANFSDAETKEIEKTEGLIAKDKAVEILTKAFSIKSMSVNYSNLNKMYPNENYIWEISLKGGSTKEPYYVRGTVDAKSGEIISFSDYREPTGKNDIGKDKAVELFKSFVNKNVQNRAEQIGEPQVTEQKSGKDKYYLVRASRKENGIDVDYDNIMIEYSTTGKIMWYNCYFTENVEFLPINNAISEEEAFDNYLNAVEFDMKYVFAENKYVPVYDVDNKYIEIDPQTGEEVTYDDEQPEITGYDDISGHWCETAVTKLIENGYALQGASFEPEKQITTKEFLNFSNIVFGSYDEEFDEYLKRLKREAPEIGEISKDSILTRRQVAIMICYEMGHQELAKLKDMFKVPFADLANDDSLGYVAICKGKGVFAGSETQNFNPQGAVTRAQAAQIIYKYISQR